MTLLTLLGIYACAFLLLFVLASFKISELRKLDPFGGYHILWRGLAAWAGVITAGAAGVIWVVQQLMRMIA